MPDRHPEISDIDTELKFRSESLDIDTMRRCGGEVVATLTGRNIDKCCVHDGRWRGASVRLITGKNSEYKMYQVGNNLGLRSLWCWDIGCWDVD